MYAIIHTSSVPFNSAIFTENIGTETNFPILFVYKFVDNFLLVLIYILQERYAPDIFAAGRAVIPIQEIKPDHKRASSRVRLLHSTSPGLITAITANVGNSTITFLVVGACICTRSLQQTMSKSHSKPETSILQDCLITEATLLLKLMLTYGLSKRMQAAILTVYLRLSFLQQLLS